jgi:hypothetical protein
MRSEVPPVDASLSGCAFVLLHTASTVITWSRFY